MAIESVHMIEKERSKMKKGKKLKIRSVIVVANERREGDQRARR